MISPSYTLDVSVDVVYAAECPYLDQASFNNTNQLHTCKQANICMNKQSLEWSIRHLDKQTATWKKQPLMVRFFHVVEIVGTTCELVGTSRVCFNHVVRSRACACTNVQRDASRHCRHYVIVLFHVVTCSTDAEPVCRAFLSSLLCRLLVITRKSRDCSVTWLQVVKVVTPWLSLVPSRDHKLWSD